MEVEATPPQPEPVVLLNARVISEQFSFDFDTRVGSSYVVQFKTAPSDAVWQALATLNGDGNRVSVTNALSSGQAFYRVLSQ